MPFLGQDVIDIGSGRVHQKYVLGAHVPLDNPNWSGPWDCAEFASWCAYQAYGIVFGAGTPRNTAAAEPYSGSWYSEAKKYGTAVPWREALKIPGAVLIRAPAPGKYGHVAFSVGDNESTLEARCAALGVGIFKNAATRSWTIGCLLPGVDYGTGNVTSAPVQPDNKPASLPPGYLWLKVPGFKGANVVALQRALKRKDVDPGPIDGEYGPMTNSAVISFQVMEGLEVDGVVGPKTAAAMALAFPISPTPQDVRIFEDAQTPKGPAGVKLPPAVGTFDAIVDIAQSGRTFRAKAASGFSFIIGCSTRYTDDMNRVGLYQDKAAIADSLQFGVYKAADFFAAFGQWAHFIEPTLAAEGEARFATLNTYDRASFTFGAPQLASHTPGENFIVYFRELLTLPDAGKHFPELSLRPDGTGTATVHLAKGGAFENLEEVIVATRPNGKKEKQITRLMAYLNSAPDAIDAAELSAAARLMNWLRLDARAKELQIEVFIRQAQEKLAKAKTKMADFTGEDWRIALWIMDILHQGRGTYTEMTGALRLGSPEEALKRIGWTRYKTRIQTVSAAVEKLAQSGVMNGFKV